MYQKKYKNDKKTNFVKIKSKKKVKSCKKSTNNFMLYFFYFFENEKNLSNKKDCWQNPPKVINWKVRILQITCSLICKPAYPSPPLFFQIFEKKEPKIKYKISDTFFLTFYLFLYLFLFHFDKKPTFCHLRLTFFDFLSLRKTVDKPQETAGNRKDCEKTQETAKNRSNFQRFSTIFNYMRTQKLAYANP